MPAPKGNKYSKGRPKGTPNPETMRFRDALAELFERSAPDMINWLEQIDSPKERFNILTGFAEFLFPKLSRTTLAGDKDSPPTININYPNANKPSV